MLKLFICLVFCVIIYKISSGEASRLSFDNEIKSLKFLSNVKNRLRRDDKQSDDGVQDTMDDHNKTEKVDDTKMDDADSFEDDDTTDVALFYKGPVCEVIDIHMRAKDLELLENCTIINGYVRILFINDHKRSDIEMQDLSRYSFPKLRVITEYLLIYRVFGLTSLHKLFPNLAVIGGEKLFSIYALTIFENADLMEIGLKNLKFIMNGGVRIENNPDLCFLETIDWNLFGKSVGNDVLAQSKMVNNNMDGCIDSCNNDLCTMKDENQIPIPRCWGPNLCQAQPCPKECPKACSSDLLCTCHENCLGGCFLPNNNSACYACKHLYHNSSCVTKCPNNTLQLAKKFCVTSSSCTDVYKSIAHEGSCLPKCPSFHKDALHPITKAPICEKCDGTCFKVCNPKYEVLKITNEKSFGDYMRCTKLNARLVISISVDSVNMPALLEEAFSELEVVGSLVVQQSKYLKDLLFFKSLKRITGEFSVTDNGSDDDEGYSIYILDNRQLRTLWKVAPDFTIDRGKAFFHFNPYLCLKNINVVTNRTLSKEDNNDVSLATNGDRVLCTTDKISNVKIETMTYFTIWEASVDISWDTPVIKDFRSLIGYNIFYKKRTMDDDGILEQDPYDESIWSKEYISKNDVNDPEKNNRTSTYLNGLDFFTKYDMFISTYTTSFASGAKSDVETFWTEATKPSFPRSIKLESLNHSAISVSWEKPVKANGLITGYKLIYSKTNTPPQITDACKGIVTFHQQKSITGKDVPEDTNSNSKNDKYNCKNSNDPSQAFDDVQDSQDFEDFLITNTIYNNGDEEEDDNIHYDDSVDDEEDHHSVKRRGISRRNFKRYKRSNNATFSTVTASTMAPRSTPTTTNMTSTDNMSSTANMSTFTTAVPVKEIQVPGNVTSFILTNLTHFSEYQVSVIVCNHASDDVGGCSKPQVGRRRTKRLEGADDILSKIQISKTGKGDYLLGFQPPKHPNGLILKYQILLKGEENLKKNLCCLATVFAQEHGCPISSQDVKPSRYTGNIRPYSLAGAGDYSEEFEINVESDSDSSHFYYFYLVLGVLVPVLAIAIVLYCRYKKSKQPPIYASVNPDYSSIGVYEPDQYEVNEDDIELIREIGHGHFGKVYEGIGQGVVFGQSETRVAVKTMHGNESHSLSKRMEFLKEATVMKAFNSYHVIRLLGVVSRSPKPMVVMEYMQNSDLKTYLRSVRPDAEERRGEPPTLAQKLQMCGEIADGMAYLADNKFVHRDLAARNCLVHENMTVKIGDFGLARDVYETDYYRIDRKGILPVRWMAPESLKDGIFDSRSDVWSYGVVLWEIANLAEQPYQGKQHEEVTRFVIDGGYMEQPRDCPKRLYDLMLMCWHYSSSMRPTFIEIIDNLFPDLSDKFKEVSFYTEQRTAVDGEVEDAPFTNGSQLSTEGLLYYNGTNGKGDPGALESAFLHMNGGRQPRDVAEQGTPLNFEDDSESVRYVADPLQSHRHTTLC